MPSTMDFPIFMYHALWPAGDDPQTLQAFWDADPQLSDPGARLYGLDVRVFERQMEQVAALRPSHFPDWERLLSAPPGEGTPWITFDDGHGSNATLAYPVLHRLKLRAIFFITTDWIDKPGFMTSEQIRHLHSSGMLIGSHGCSHHYFSDMTEVQLHDEMVRSRQKLEALLGAPIETLSLPGGRNHAAIRSIAHEVGYRHLFTSTPELARPGGDPLDWPRIPITHTQSSDFLPRLIKGDRRPLQAMRRSAQRRDLAKRLLGNRLYDGLRGWALRLKG